MTGRHAVHFVGTGSGDPELMTVKGQRLLREAYMVIYTGSHVSQDLITDLPLKYTIQPA